MLASNSKFLISPIKNAAVPVTPIEFSSTSFSRIIPSIDATIY